MGGWDLICCCNFFKSPLTSSIGFYLVLGVRNASPVHGVHPCRFHCLWISFNFSHQWSVSFLNLSSFGVQTVQHRLAEMKTSVCVSRAFVDQCLNLLNQGLLDSPTASMAKYWASDLFNRIAYDGVQLHGGWGYMWEYAICKTYVDARVQSIYGGSNEIMKELIGRSIVNEWGVGWNNGFCPFFTVFPSVYPIVIIWILSAPTAIFFYFWLFPSCFWFVPALV